MLRFDIYGVIIELYNGNKQLRSYLRKELEYFLSDRNKKFDIKIDFVNQLRMHSKLKSIGNSAEFGNNDFYLRLHTSRTHLPFHNIGRKIEIESETSVPLNRVIESIIEPAVYFKLLAKKFAFIHSSAIFFNNTGIIFPAWMHAGKTELLFEFMKKGAQFMADDWTFVSASGDIYAYPRPIKIHPHTFHFSKTSEKYTSKSFVPSRKRFSWRSSLSRSEESSSVSLHDAFPNALIQKTCNLDIIVHLLRYRGKEISIVEEDPNEIIERILSTTKFARMYDFLPFYALYKFAFPKRKNHIIETAEEAERKILMDAFRGKPVFSLKIPLIANPSNICDILLENLF